MSRIAERVDAFERGRLSRRDLILQLTALAAGAGAVRAAQDAQPQPTFLATDVNHLALSVTDVARSRDFYQRHLGLTMRSDSSPQSCFLNVGRHDFLALFRAERPGMDHYCYTVKDYTADSAVERLKAAGLTPRRVSNRVYFDDPDGLEVQVSAANRVR